MKTLISFLFLVSAALAQNNTGTLVIAPVRPQASNDTFPSAIANEIKGGPFSVATTAAMSNISSERLVAGSLAYVTNDSSFRIYNGTNWSQSGVRDAIGLGWSALTNTNAATSLLGYTTNGQVVYGGSNTLSMPATIIVDSLKANTEIVFQSAFSFDDVGSLDIQETSRANLGFSTNLNTLWMATNASNARSAVGLSETSAVTFERVIVNSSDSASAFRFGTNLTGLWSGVDGRSFSVRAGGNNLLIFQTNRVLFFTNITFDGDSSGVVASQTRTNLGLGFPALTNTNVSSFRESIGLGDTNTVTFGGIVNNGNFTNNNGTIYGLKTNVGPFEGIGNFFASNNTTVSNETLFRVGLAEATNKSAQFGFRVTRTNNGGEGVAVYSVFGYNALMMIGPSDRSRINYATNTNAGIEATLWTITPTNQVMTLRDTNTGATTFHQSLGFDTNVTSTAPANTTNIVKWIEVWVGTNNYRMPLYQ